MSDYRNYNGRDRFRDDEYRRDRYGRGTDGPSRRDAFFDDERERGYGYQDARGDRYGYGRSGPSERYGEGYGRYGRSEGYRDGYGSFNRYRDDDSNAPGERSFFERAGDEVASWFGDRDAERRREIDRQYAGRGPKGYTRSDERIHDDVNDRLTDDHYLDAHDIEVAVKDREVTLTGFVATREQRRRAEDIAERVSGVVHVQNNLRVQTAGTSQSGLFGGSSTSSDTVTVSGFGRTTIRE